METNNISAGNKKTNVSVLSRVWNLVSGLFQPEEVEVTFKEDLTGHITSYTYTVVDHHKQVA